MTKSITLDNGTNTLDAYEEYSGTITTPDTGYTEDLAADDCHFTRVGNQVTCRMRFKFDWSTPADSSPDLIFGSLPLAFRPSNPFILNLPAYNTTGGYEQCIVAFETDGSGTLYRTTAFGGFPSGTGTWYTGHPTWDYWVTFSYTLD